MKKRRTVAEINAKIEKGEGVVMTAEELCNCVRSGGDVDFDDVDVVTSATCGVMSGTFAVLSFRVAEREAFERATTILLNDVPGFVGPCPNERLGVVDVLVYGASHANARYGGGHLFRDLVAQKEIEVAVGTVEGRRIETTTCLEEISFARLCSTRNAFKNYYAFVNARENEVSSIFAVDKFKGPFKELSFSGCGELNPLEKDPFRDTIGVGTKILMNGAVGFVIGEGTRSSPEKPNLMGIADMHGMIPEYLGGFRTSAGPEVLNSWAVPIPVLNEQVLENTKRLDGGIKLLIMDVHTRLPVGEITYDDVWRDRDLSVRFDASKCIECEECQVTSMCPTDAFDVLAKEVNEDLCSNCGACVHVCEGEAFNCNLGVVYLSGRKIPVTLRQSDRKKAAKLAEMLKRKILDGDFILAEPVNRL